MRRAESHGGKLKIFASEQICVCKKQDNDSEPGQQDERQREQIDKDRERSDLDTFYKCTQKRQGSAGWMRRIVFPLDGFGDFIDEKAPNEGSDRRHQE